MLAADRGGDEQRQAVDVAETCGDMWAVGGAGDEPYGRASKAGKSGRKQLQRQSSEGFNKGLKRQPSLEAGMWRCNPPRVPVRQGYVR